MACVGTFFAAVGRISVRFRWAIVLAWLAGTFAALAPDIAYRQHLHIFSARVSAGHIRPGASQQMSAALATHADEPHRDALTGRDRALST